MTTEEEGASEYFSTVISSQKTSPVILHLEIGATPIWSLALPGEIPNMPAHERMVARGKRAK
jgi:hypothetical protein